MTNPTSTIDTLICVGPKDINSLFLYSLKSLFKNFPFLGDVYIVTPDRNKIVNAIKTFDFVTRVQVLQDSDVLSKTLMKEDGWYRQQIIKLSAHKICKSRCIASLCSDTVILKELSFNDLFDKDGSPVLYVRKHETHSPHVDYEKQRIAHVFKTLKITDANLDEYFDFIIDFKICDTTLLEELNRYLAKTYGKNYFKKISPGKCPSLKEKVVIAEWTLMGAFAMHIYHQQVHLKSYTNKFITQIHTQGDMDKFKYDSKIVHFVKKNLDFEKIRERLDAII